MSGSKTKTKDKPKARTFGAVVRRLRVTDQDEADALTRAGARMTREDGDGFHFEMDAQAASACEA